MRAVCGRAYFVLIVLLALSAAPAKGQQNAADPGLAVRRAVVYYPLGGATASALRAQLAASGPRDRRTGRRYAGRTEYRIAWRFSFAPGEKGCSITTVTARLDLTQTYPLWEPGPGASKRLQRKWRKYLSALTRHEDGHGRTALDGGIKLLRTIRSLEPRASCEELAAAARQACRRIIAETDLSLRLEDAATGHGRSEGARLP